MIIQYCQKCGVRVSEQDLQSGKAVAQGENLFCERCRAAAAPLPQPQSTSVLAAQKGTARRAPTSAPAGRTTGRPESPPSAPPQPLMLYGGIGAGVLLLGLIYFLTSGPSGTTKTTASKPPTSAHDEPRPSSSGNPVAQPGATPGPPAAPPTGAAKTEKDPEAEASDEFDRLRRFEGLAADDKAGRMARIEAYLRKYGEAIVARRARALLNELKNPPAEKPVAAAAQPAGPAPAPQVPAGAAAELPSTYKEDFEGAEIAGWSTVFAEPVADPTNRAQGHVLKLKLLSGDLRGRFMAGDFPGQTPQLNHGAVLQIKPGARVKLKYYTTGVTIIDIGFRVVGIEGSFSYKIREPKLNAWTEVDLAFGNFSLVKGAEVVNGKAPESGLIGDANVWGFGPAAGSIFCIDDFEIGVPAAEKAKP
ncbi:MAG: hypothetical protein HY291_04285 [Planctomycetes bacterium]|nr:hypothetical protein [Planctomycetota bacterium]